jgi:hypothetical protein
MQYSIKAHRNPGHKHRTDMANKQGQAQPPLLAPSAPVVPAIHMTIKLETACLLLVLCSFDKANAQVCTYTCRHDHATFYSSHLQKGVGMRTRMYTYTTRHNRAHAYAHVQV